MADEPQPPGVVIYNTALPFEPETLASARARYPLALEPEYPSLAFLDNATPDVIPAPAADRRNCFDFSDGLRLIAFSVEDAGVVVLATFHGGSKLYTYVESVRAADGLEAAGAALRGVAMGRYIELAGPGVIFFIGYDARGWPCWRRAKADPGGFRAGNLDSWSDSDGAATEDN